MIPSKYQLDILNNLHQSMLIQACAGAGKTTLLRMVADTIPRGKSILCVAFNKPIADEMRRKLPRHVVCSTLHSLGYRSLGRDVQVEQSKLANSIETVLADVTQEKTAVLRNDLYKLIPLIMGTLTDPCDYKAVAKVIDRVGVTIEDLALSLPYLSQVIDEMDKVQNFITFDEMIYRPVIRGINVGQFDYVLVDETQDLNECQQGLVQAAVKPEGIVIAVGDRYQSIYGFRGADPAAMDEMKKRFSMVEKLLPVTYRCPSNVVTLAQKVVGKDIITTSDTCREGEVIRERDYPKIMSQCHDGDMVLCRINAPLVRGALKFIREGKKAVVRGRDIGAELATLVKRQKARTIDTLTHKLAAWLNREKKKALAEDSPGRLQAAEDKLDTIMAVIESCASGTVTEVLNKIETIFSDQITGTIFSSIHRAKGLEAVKVVLLRPDLLPHPAAQKSRNVGFALAQERNLEYVAYTRCRETLIIHEA